MGNASKVIVQYMPNEVGPRDQSHRRVAEQVTNRFDDTEAYYDARIAALVAAIEGLGGTVSFPNPSVPPQSGGIGG